MSMTPPVQLEFVQNEPTDAAVGAFIGYLSWNGWRTRRHLTKQFGISERQVRQLAERAGAQVIRWGMAVKKRLHQRIK